MLLPLAAATLLTLFIALVVGLTSRLHAILPPNRPLPIKRKRSSKPGETRHGHILIVLGSGGHTAEMLLMLQTIQLWRWERRTWIVSSGDGFSARRAGEFEASLRQQQQNQTQAGKNSHAQHNYKDGEFEIVTIPRARRVHQPLLTTPVSSLQCLWACINIVRGNVPDVVLTNGPGTGVIVVLASLILRFFDFGFGGISQGSSKTRAVYVESLARVKKLSLSGRILVRLVDRFLVQWEQLEGIAGRSEYRGALVLNAAKEVGINNVYEGKERDTSTAERIRYAI